MEKAGGKCLPCVVDIREEAQVQKAVSQAVERFGGIDILVNNASAIHLTGTVETPMKRYYRLRYKYRSNLVEGIVAVKVSTPKYILIALVS